MASGSMAIAASLAWARGALKLSLSLQRPIQERSGWRGGIP